MTEARHPTTIDLLERSSDTERYRLLSSTRRRVVLRILSEAGHGFDLETLAERVATREAETGAAADEALRRVERTLHHNHLPRLAHHDVVSYDRETNRIEPLNVREANG